MVDDEVLVELQTQLSFQEDTITQLNDVVARQQLEIRQLQQQFSALKEQVKSGLRTEPVEQEAPPPHY